MTRRDAGLDVLVRSARERARPASVRNMVTLAGAAQEGLGQIENIADRMERLRVPLAEAGADVLIRESRGPRSRTGVGQIVTSEETLGSRVRQMDNDFNALMVAVYGSARALPTNPTPAGTALGASWRTSFLATMEQWRNTRDELRDSSLMDTLLRSATAWHHRLDAFQSDLTRYSSDVARVSGGVSPIPSPPPAPTLPITLDTGAARAAEAASGIATAIAVVAVAGVVGFIVYEGSSVAKKVM